MRCATFGGIVLLAALAAPAGAAPLPPPFLAPVPGYVQSRWTTADGLPQNLVQDIVQTRDGYLWVATGNGLARFDGLRFVVFDRVSSPTLPSNWINTLFEDGAGNLWIGTDTGVVRSRGQHFERIQLPGALHDGVVISIDQDPRGRIWVIGRRAVAVLEGEAWQEVDLGAGEYFGGVADRGGDLWVGSDRGLVHWRERVVHVYTEAEGMPAEAVVPLLDTRAGELWVGAVRHPGVVRMSRTAGQVRRGPEELQSLTIDAMAEGADGTLWFSTPGALHRLGREQTLERLAITWGSGDRERISSILEDEQGQVFLAVSRGGGGLRRLRPAQVSMVGAADGLPCENVLTVTEGADGTAWVGLMCEGEPGLVAIRDGRVRVVRDAEGEPLHQVSALLALPGRQLWAGNLHGQLVRIAADGKLERPFTGATPFAGSRISTLHQDGEGRLWVGGESGLHRWSPTEGWRSFTAADGLAHTVVRVITADRDGSLWIGTQEGVSHLVDGGFENLTAADGLPVGPARAIHFDPRGSMWVGTYGGGLARVRNGSVTRFGTRRGLLDNGVHRILEDEDGMLWLSGDHGIRRVARAELDAIAEGRSTQLRVEVFDELDGMFTAEANGVGQPAGWRMRDGEVWFPTQGGVARLDPLTLVSDVPSPRPRVEEIRVDGRVHPAGDLLELPPGRSDVEIRYTAPYFVRAGGVRFFYRLRGHDGEWVDAGTRRVASYPHLPPGQYVFELKARAGASLWNENSAALAFELPSRFHHRWSFRIAAIGLAVLVLGGLVRWRLAHLRWQAEQLEATIEARTAELTHEREILRAVNRRLGRTNEQLQAAKQTAEAAHRQLVSMLDQLHIGVIVVDGGERVRYVSEAAERLLETRGVRTVVGEVLADVLPLPATTWRDLRARLRAPGSGERVTARLDRGNGTGFWAEIEVRPDPRDERDRILCLHDVTETVDLNSDGAGTEDGVRARLVGTSPAMRQVHAQVRTLAGFDATVLIEGETGTGKELVARAIHEESRRGQGPFVAVNCAGLTESLLASQLFGHKRGAFTGALTDHVGLFEAAQGGTLLLDEIGDMPISMQTHLLRVLQEREIFRVGDSTPRAIDVRVLAATHRNLDGDVAAGRFREDLLYRIRVARIQLPPLRHRIEDIPQIAAAFLASLAVRHGKSFEGFGREAMDVLLAHDWPGNVRELRSTVEWAVIHATTPVIRTADLPPELVGGGAGTVPPAVTRVPQDGERQRLMEALERTGGNRTVAARLLGISRATLYRRLARLDPADPLNPRSIPPDRSSPPEN